jgi:alanine racemase
MTPVARSHFTLDLGAVRANVRHLAAVLGSAELWAVVKADAYGHGAADIAPAALDAGATALCVATVPEALALRPHVPAARVIVLGPSRPADIRAARQAGLELVAAVGPVPEGVPVHLKLDTGMGRWGLRELPAPGREVVGLMTHFAASDSDPAFTGLQLERFLAATADVSHLSRHAANSAAALRLPASRLDAARCGIALYGISPFGDDPGSWGLRPALRWESEIAATKRLGAGDSTGYGRTFVATESTWLGIVPVGYADGFRRDMTGTEVLVGDTRRAVVGTVSMDAVAVRLPEPVDVGTPVTLLGDGVLAESHAHVAATIAYEITCGLDSGPPRATREVLDA